VTEMQPAAGFPLKAICEVHLSLYIDISRLLPVRYNNKMRGVVPEGRSARESGTGGVLAGRGLKKSVMLRVGPISRRA